MDDGNFYKTAWRIMFFSSPFLTSSKNVFAPPAPTSPYTLAFEYKPAGPFWQNTARTVAANVGDPVRVWDDASGNGRHAVTPTDALRPLRDSGGGVDWNSSTGSNFRITYVYSGVASIYYCGLRDDTTSSEMICVEPETESNYLWMINSSLTRLRCPAGINIANRNAAAPVTKTVVSGVTNGAGAASWCGLDLTKETTLAGTLSNFDITSYLRFGSRYDGVTDACKGKCRAFAFAAAGHNDTQWQAMVNYQLSL